MTDPNTIPVVSQTIPPVTPADPDRALLGKIARLPEDIRNQLNQRLLDGQAGAEVLPWLNGLPRVKQILAARFDGVPVNHENLSNWRHSGFQRWLDDRASLEELKELGKYALEVARATDGQLAPAAAAIASRNMIHFLKAANTEQPDPDNVVKCAFAAATLAKTEQNNARIRIASQRLRQHDLALVPKRDKQQRDAAAIGLRLLANARAKEIAASNAEYKEKIEMLGYHMFGDFWEPRRIPTPKDFNPAPTPQPGRQEPPNPLQ